MPDPTPRRHRSGPLWRRLRTNPRVADPDEAAWRVADLVTTLDPTFRALIEKPRVKALVAGIADHSPYLWGLIKAEPQRFGRLLAEDPETHLKVLLAGLLEQRQGGEEDLMRRLREAKREVALLVALADLGGVWTLEAATQALSFAADVFVGHALRFLLRDAHATGRLKLNDPDHPERGCGIVVLGLGKLGGCELNYSSDIDIIVVFDPESAAVTKIDGAKTLFVRLVRDLVRILQLATADGYVHRVDLRLRPDPGATAVAIGLGAAFRYYEMYGQNWERAAMIKARPVAGDLVLGQTFLEGMVPFIWRRYFDYAAIADIHAMKRQIHAAKGGGEIAVAGHNVKLGRGGIREVEFFVQTQQLIFGGKRPDLRGSRTLPMLRELRRDGWIGTSAVAELTRAYTFLRRVEHRLQMLADEQTHSLPASPEALQRFARFCGFASLERFAAVFMRHLRRVVHHYALLFEHAPALDDAAGSLVFTGVADDPETLETLSRLGYRSPDIVSHIVRDWHAGRRSAVRSARARETLTDLIPKLLVTFARASDPDGAVAAFDSALEHMPAAGELFAILAANATVRSLFGDVLGSAPRLASAVTARPHLLDAVIDPAVVSRFDEDAMETRAALILARARTTEEFLDGIRDFHGEEHFLIGAGLMSGDLDPDRAGEAYTALAVSIIRVALRQLRVDFTTQHGSVPQSALAILAMGKLGSREMTATSDLDLVILYDFNEADPESDGARPLHASRYFTRLAQRLVSNLTVATRRGRLYEVDMRLRPSGRQGPLATKLSAFARYQRSEAATWEHMALTRARLVAGDAVFRARVGAELAAILRRRSKPTVRGDVVAMRALLEREKPAKSDWDLKLSTGGLIDIEFIAQTLVLQHAAAKPEIAAAETQSILQRAKSLGFLAADDADRLLSAHRLYTNTTQIMRLALDEAQDPETAGTAVKRWLAAASGVPDFKRLKEDIAESRQAVREIFLALLSSD